MGELDAARAQVEQHDRQAEATKAQTTAIDADAIVVEELAALRRTVAGEIREGRDGDLDQLRALLRRLFVGLELAGGARPFGSGVLGRLSGRVHVGTDDGPSLSPRPATA
jgi:hypothetical protein